MTEVMQAVDGGDEERQGGQAAAAHPVSGLESSVVILGGGILGSTPGERHTDRYGAVHLTVLDSIPGIPAPPRTVVVPGTTSRVVAFDHAPLGATGTLVAQIVATARYPKMGPQPEPGDRIVLGSGTLFTETDMGAPVIGVRPADGRETDWMDADAIQRCRDHLVRLDFEMPAAAGPGPAGISRTQAREVVLDTSAAERGSRAAQLEFPQATPAAPGRTASASRRRPTARNETSRGHRAPGA